MTFLVGRDTYDAHVESFSGNGSTTGFTLANSTTTNSLVCRINGVVQRNGTDFTVSGQTLTFSTAPAAGTNNIVAQYFGVGTLQIPTDASVTEAKMGSDSVSEAKLKVSNSPTNGTFLQAQSGASGGLTWAEAGGGWEFVSSATASSSASLSFTNMASGYDYDYQFSSVLPATDNATMKANLGIAGPTYRTSNYKDGEGRVGASSGTASGILTTDGISIGVAGAGNQADEGWRAYQISLYSPADASVKTTFLKQGVFFDSGSTVFCNTGGGVYTVAEAQTSIKFVLSSGNIASGVVKQYRRANA